MSIISSNDYEDLGNHATEAIGETGLFSIAQVKSCRPLSILPVHLAPSLINLCFQAMVMMKGLMGWCLNHETTLDRVRAMANETKEELNGLKAWKVGMDKKFATSEKVRKELEEHMEMLKKVLEDKEKEVKDAKDQLRQVKEVAVREYRDSDDLLEELGTSYADGFDDALRQFKKAYPDLDCSQFKIDTQAQATVQPIASDSTEDLFADDAGIGDGASAPAHGQV